MGDRHGLESIKGGTQKNKNENETVTMKTI